MFFGKPTPILNQQLFNKIGTLPQPIFNKAAAPSSASPMSPPSSSRREWDDLPPGLMRTAINRPWETPDFKREHPHDWWNVKPQVTFSSGLSLPLRN